MRKLLFTAVAAVLLSLPSLAQAQSTTWIAFAVNDRGWGFARGGSEEHARRVAILRCEHETGYTCSRRTVSVPNSWYLIAVNCNGRSSTAGSRHGYHTAKAIAAQKVGAYPSSCWVMNKR